MKRLNKNYPLIPSFSYLGLLFFLIIIFIGISTYKDYGISWDERVERLDGLVALRFIESRSEIKFPGLDSTLQKQDYSASLDLHDYKDRYYPVGFNMPMEAFIQILGIEEEQAAYYFRHLITFSICLIGLWAIYSLALRRFSDWKMGALISLMYVLSPRLYGESFYNSKDMVLLSFFSVAMNFAILYLQKTNFKNAFLFGLSTALTLNIRLMAIILPLLVLAMLVGQVVRRKVGMLAALSSFLFYSIIVLAVMFVMWPLLWDEPVGKIMEALSFMAHYQFHQDVIYFGEKISSFNLPWHYLPVWIGITTPVPYVLLWFVGLIAICKESTFSKWQLWTSDEQMQDLFFLALFIGPLLGFMVLKPVIYDGWRHFYFLYPAFLMIAIRGYWAIIHSSKVGKKIKALSSSILAISFSASLVWMVLVHPLQNVYFNFLVGSNWKAKFDVDYWGLSNRIALEHILLSDPKEKIYIKDGAYNFLPLTLSILDKQDANRIAFTRDPDIADYLITNYRLNLTDYAALPSNWALEKHIYAGTEVISSIYKAKRNIYASRVQVGDPIYFGKESFGQYFLKSGDWALPEEWGVWAQKPMALMYLPLPQSTKMSIQWLELNLRALVSKSHPLQKIAVRINDGESLFFNLKNRESNLIRVPLSNSLNFLGKESGEGALKVEIESFNAIKPSQLGIGDDQRLLSVGLISAELVSMKR